MGKPRKTPADYHVLAQERGFEWVGADAQNIETKTRWRCAKGHEWDARYHDIWQGTGCPYCANRLPKTPADYHALAAERGFEWLGPEASNIKVKTHWRCPEGHIFSMRYNSVQQGQGCPYCAGLAPKTAADYHTLAQKRGLEWIGDLPLNIKSKTNWRCNQGHAFQISYNELFNDRNCPYCSGSRLLPNGHLVCQQCGDEFPATPEYFVASSRTKRGISAVCLKCAQAYWSVRNHRRLARKRKLPNDFTPEEWRRCLDYFNHSCAVCGQTEDLWTILSQDHWVALSDSSTPGHVAANVVPLCHPRPGAPASNTPPCNLSKGAKPAAEWLIQRYGQRKAAEILRRIEAYFEWVHQQGG